MNGKVPERQAERQIAAIRKQERTLGQRLGRLRHGLPVRDRGLPGRGAGDGLEARRRAGALPGDGFLVAPAADRTNPGPPELIALTRNAEPGHPPARCRRRVNSSAVAREPPSPRPDARVPGPACSRDAGGSCYRASPAVYAAGPVIVFLRIEVEPARWSARRVLAAGCGGW